LQNNFEEVRSILGERLEEMRRFVNLWIERWRRCIFIIFYFKTVFISYKTARISVHIRHLFIESECLLIGCVSYIK
jgi:hypothetical protein